MSQQIFTKPRGTVDLIGPDYDRYLAAIGLLRSLAHDYGCQFIQTPAFEESGLFLRSVGASSDIVRKETFDLANKGSSKDYTLRPEFTAGVVRALIENKMYASPDTPIRLCYWGPVYRYERPGTGRLREFRQFGVEFFDVDLDFNAQAEALSLAYYGAEKIVGHPLVLTLNYLGGEKARTDYRKALVDYFSKYIANMCDDCKDRLKLNPLRILDCKVEADQKIVAGAPKIEDYLSQEDKDEFASVRKVLDQLGIKTRIDDRLVRGLDYYTGTVFEIEDPTNAEFGALGGGGKYAGLVAQLGGPELEGIGFSYGIDRLLGSAGAGFKPEESGFDAIVLAMAKKPDCELKASLVAQKIRNGGLAAVVPTFSKSAKGSFKMADRLKCHYAVLINEDLTIDVKDLEKREQFKVEEGKLLDVLKGAKTNA